MKMKGKKRYVVIVIVFMAGSWLLGGEFDLDRLMTLFTTSSVDEGVVHRVVDGDTIEVEINGEIESVRLLCVDTPESVHPDEGRNTQAGIEASNFTKEYLEGEEVWLEYDVEKEDKYGRLLAYVYINDGEDMFNIILVEEGYAEVVFYSPNNKYEEAFNMAELTSKTAVEN